MNEWMEGGRGVGWMEEGREGGFGGWMDGWGWSTQLKAQVGRYARYRRGEHKRSLGP